MVAVLVLAGIGFILVIAEMFLPGGVLGALGAILLLAAIVVGYVQLGPFGGTLTFGAIAVLSIAGFCTWMAAFPKTKIGRRLILGRNLESGSELPKTSDSLVGSSGSSLTPLRPAGKALINGTRVDVVAEGSFIDSGEEIVVVLAEGSRIVVRKKVGESSGASLVSP